MEMVGFECDFFLFGMRGGERAGSAILPDGRGLKMAFSNVGEGKDVLEKV